MIKIDDSVPVPEYSYGPSRDDPVIFVNSGVPLPSEQIKHKMDRGLKKIVARFNEAYQRVYGCPPVVVYDKPWLKVSGVDNRVSRQRLLEMAKQLEYRAG